MYFKKRLKELFGNEEINIFVDMDGVIADYGFDKPLNFKEKRALKTNINTLSKIGKEPNINLYILSICKKNTQIDDKNEWLDKYAPIFARDKRYIISKEEYKDYSSKEIKLMILKEIIAQKHYKNMVLIDDDNGILKYIKESEIDITLFQDSSLIE